MSKLSLNKLDFFLHLKVLSGYWFLHLIIFPFVFDIPTRGTHILFVPATISGITIVITMVFNSLFNRVVEPERWYLLKISFPLALSTFFSVNFLEEMERLGNANTIGLSNANLIANTISLFIAFAIYTRLFRKRMRERKE